MKKQKAFTLVELIVYVAVISVVVVGFLNFGLNVIYSGKKTEIRLDVDKNTTDALQVILARIKSADSIDTGNSTFDVSPGVLTLNMSDSGVDPTIFDTSGGILRMTEGLNSPVDLTSGDLSVSNLVFTDLSVAGRTSNVKVQLTATHINASASNLADIAIAVEGSATIRKQANP